MSKEIGTNCWNVTWMDMNEIEIMSTPKNVFQNQIKSLINKAAFKYFFCQLKKPTQN